MSGFLRRKMGDYSSRHINTTSCVSCCQRTPCYGYYCRECYEALTYLECQRYSCGRDNQEIRGGRPTDGL